MKIDGALRQKNQIVLNAFRIADARYDKMGIGLIFKFIDKAVPFRDTPGCNHDHLTAVRQSQPLSDQP